MKLRITLFAVAGASALVSLPLPAAFAQEVVVVPMPPPPYIVQYRSLQEPDRYPPGSTRWWRSMDYESRGGFN